jgi:hypothetical protein
MQHGVARRADATFNRRFEPHGTFDAESGEIIATALEAEIEALDHDGETRARPHRRADALTSICRWYLAEHDGASKRRRNQTRVSVVVDLTELTGTDTMLLADVRAEAAHAGRLSRATLQRLACDAKISRVLTDGTSQILDVGRSTRDVTTAQWNALVARDRHCTTPGCTMTPGFCEAHHIRYWSLGGPTNLNTHTTTSNENEPRDSALGHHDNTAARSRATSDVNGPTELQFGWWWQSRMALGGIVLLALFVIIGVIAVALAS